MKFKRTSYLTRLAALGVAAATLMVPLADVSPAFAKETSGTEFIAASAKTRKNTNFTPEQLRHINPTLAKAFENYGKKDQFNKNSNAQVTVVVTLKNNHPQLTDYD